MGAFLAGIVLGALSVLIYLNWFLKKQYDIRLFDLR